MENKKTKKGLIWLILVVAAVTVAAVVVGILYFAPQEAPAPAPAPTTRDEVAAQFIEAYMTRDRLTQFDLFLYDARAQWVDKRIKDHGSEEEFCKVVQEQADEKGIDVTINCFDDYLRGYHQQDLVYKKETYGDFTITSTTIGSEKMAADRMADYVANVAGAVGTNYFADGVIDAIDEVYIVTVALSIDGTRKDLNEKYMVYMVNHDGQWLVLSHTT